MRLSRIEWPTAAVLVAVIAAIVTVWVVSPDHRGDILAGIGTVGAIVLAVMRALMPPPPPPPPPPDDPIARPRRRPTMSPMMALALLVLAPGCSPSALRTHQTIATIARVSVVAAHPAIVSACETLMQRCTDDACLERVGHDCETAAVARDTAHAAVRAYVDTIQIAAHADEGRVAPALDLALSTLARAYDAAREAIARLTGYQLPALPPEALVIIRMLTAGAVGSLGSPQ